jgi:hypothetical protein
VMTSNLPTLLLLRLLVLNTTWRLTDILGGG